VVEPHNRGDHESIFKHSTSFTVCRLGLNVVLPPPWRLGQAALLLGDLIERIVADTGQPKAMVARFATIIAGRGWAGDQHARLNPRPQALPSCAPVSRWHPGVCELGLR
jgi:hypothetical protein